MRAARPRAERRRGDRPLRHPDAHLPAGVDRRRRGRGREFPAGTEFALCLASANRDEDAFERAETFDITRPPHANVVFGQGPHYCPGAGLARRQAEISLRLLAERLPGLRLVPDQRIEYRGTLDHRGPLALRLEW
ncbi:cytochrome P450 [Nonomuraea thailandensis]